MTSGHELADHVALAGSLAGLLPELTTVARRLIEVYERDGRLFTFGNGGSAADAQHLAGELVGRYRRYRRPLAALALTTDPSVTTCISNDFGSDDVFVRQVRAFARPGDMVLAFSTSGRSANVVQGLAAAREQGAVTVLLTGSGAATAHADHTLVVASTTTARIQEMHLVLLHLLSEQVDAWAAATEPSVAAGGRA